MAREIPVGIDLGTTFSAVATLDAAGRSVLLNNAEGDCLTPSLVLFGKAEVVVGKAARHATTIKPDLVAEWVKRDMGAPYYSRPIHGQYLPPEVIQACILRKLRADIVRELGENVRCVITVPAYFDENRRKATADAGDLAGLSVLDIVNEPTAAALSFGELAGYLGSSGPKKPDLIVLVYDLGGGTFDGTLLKLSQNNIQTLATDGDVRLGGHDWDLRLLNYVADEFQKQHQIDLRADAISTNRLLASVIEAKHTISARQKTIVRVDHDGRSAEIPVTRELFTSLTADLLDRTACTTRQLIAEAKLQPGALSRVLLVGGSTRMPMVGEMLEKLTGLVPDRTVNPDEAVARGAALYAGYLLAKQAGGASGQAGGASAFEVTNVNSHSLGIEGIDGQTRRKVNVILIPRNTPLPAIKSERFVTKTENQRSIVVRVLEGESLQPNECATIGRTSIRDLPLGLPQGWPIGVSFAYATNGRLSVRATVPGTDQNAVLNIERTSGMTRERIDRWKPPIQEEAGFDVFEALVEEALAGDSSSENAGLKMFSPPPTDLPEQGMATAAASSRDADEGTISSRDTHDGPRSSEGMVLVVGYVLSAVIGLGLGYLVLSWFRPDDFPRPW